MKWASRLSILSLLLTCQTLFGQDVVVDTTLGTYRPELIFDLEK